MKINYFSEDLDFSYAASDEDFWQEIYRKAFPDMACQMKYEEKSQSQQLGIDRIIHLKSGRTIYIDEKKRRTVYEDIALEYEHISDKGLTWPGWIEKQLSIDYLAYAFMPIKKVLLYDWPMLRRAWVENKEDWFNRFEKITAENKGYKTWSLCVPFADLHKAVSVARVIVLQ
jgi:hypothetical protein